MAYFKKNYIAVLQDVRGCYMSEDTFQDVRPYIRNKEAHQTDEASDTYDTIDWLIKNVKNNNEKVGVFGFSYMGFYATMAALSGHPALKAVSPQAPVTDWFIGDDYHHNGVFMEMDAFNFSTWFDNPRPSPTTVGPSGFQYYTNDSYEFFINAGPLKDLAKLTGDSLKFWNELYRHPNYDSRWQVRNTRNDVSDIPSKVATLEVGGPMGGYQMLVRGDIMRGRYRNSFQYPEPFKPGQVTEVKYTLNDVAHTFKKGHRIMVQVQSTWFPLADRNPQQFVDIYTCDASAFIPARIRIFSSKEHPSILLLPVVK